MAENPFEYVKSINQGRYAMGEELSEKGYNPFLINRQFSYFPDTVLMANELNQRPHLDNRLQYDFFINIIRPKKRFSKWAKPDRDKDLAIIKEYYQYSTEKALQIMRILSDDDLKTIKKKMEKGGKT